MGMETIFSFADVNKTRFYWLLWQWHELHGAGGCWERVSRSTPYWHEHEL